MRVLMIACTENDGCIFIFAFAADQCVTGSYFGGDLSYHDSCTASEAEVFMVTGEDFLGKKCEGTPVEIRNKTRFVLGTPFLYVRS